MEIRPFRGLSLAVNLLKFGHISETPRGVEANGIRAMKSCSDAASARPESTGAARPKVLVVDDEPLIGLLYHRHIEKAGFHLLTASTAQDGLLMAQREAPALIIVDVILPQVDGLSLVRQLKAAESTKNIPTIVFTAVLLQEHFATAREASLSGATVFLTKPISPDRLVSEMKRLVAPKGRNDLIR